MKNYYVQIQQYLERLIHHILVLDKKGVTINGEVFSLVDLLMIRAVGTHGEKKMFQVMEEMNLDRNAFVGVVNRLQSQKLILKRKDEEDKRVQLLQLTEKGQGVLEALQLLEKELLSKILRDATFNEEKAILKFLVKLDMLSRNPGSSESAN